MPDDAPRVAIIACPLCQKRHVVRVNGGRARVDCGALAEVFEGTRYTEARVWPTGREGLAGRMATVIAVQDAGP